MYLLGRIFISVYCCPLKLFIIFTSPFYAMSKRIRDAALSIFFYLFTFAA